MAVKKTTSTKKKKVYRKKEKSERKNLKGWMDGKREEVCAPLVPVLADALEHGWQAGEHKLLEIFNLYHFHFPPTMPLYEDPPELKEYDPTAPAPNYEKGKMPEEVAELRHIINLRNDMLRRWFKYHLRALGKGVRKLMLRTPDDPLEKILRGMAGLDKAPKQPHAAHVYLEANRAAVLKAAATQWNAEKAKGSSTGEAGTSGGGQTSSNTGEDTTGVDARAADHEKQSTASRRKSNAPKGPSVTYTTTLARKMLAALPKDEQNRYAEMAKEQGNRAKEEHELAKVAPPLTDPLVVAKISDGAENLLLDVSQGVERVVLLRIFSLFGGPTHDSNGEMTAVCVTTAKNKAPVPLSFVDWLGPKKIEELRMEYKRWLGTCFTEDEKKAVLLPDGAEARARSPHPAKSGNMVELLKGLHSMDDDDSSESDDSDSDDDDDVEDDDSEDEEEVATKKEKGKAQPTPRQKAVPKQKATSAKTTPPALVLSQYEVNRNANMDRNRRLLAALSHMQENNAELDEYATKHNIDANTVLPPTLFGEKPKTTKRKRRDDVGDSGKENKRVKAAAEPKMTRAQQKEAKEKAAKEKEIEKEKALKEKAAALEREAAREREAAMQVHKTMEAKAMSEANAAKVVRPKPIPTAQLKKIAPEKEKEVDGVGSGVMDNGAIGPGGGNGDIEMAEENGEEY
ncbi:hypothetical protein BDZ89DRAFT_1130299 [Hymenopellis radicata]|nr:hypothetical protein BDZ89DRAFT_1130299 [Hymenopellis radicata]